jgi:hypothetical protein
MELTNITEYNKIYIDIYIYNNKIMKGEIQNEDKKL